MKLCIFTGINIGGAVGWSLGETVGTMTALLASGVGGVLGVYFGWLVARKYLNVAVRSKQDSGQAKQDTLCGKAGQRIRGAS
jgi:membrane protein YqaA with SNARE-associated domain